MKILFDMTGFHGWRDGSLWNKIRFDMKHFSNMDRLAVVGGNKYQHDMTKHTQSFTSAEVRYFGETDATEARRWLEDTGKY
jgi:alanine racemase